MRAEELYRVVREIHSDIEDIGIEVLLPQLVEALLAHANSPTAETQMKIAEAREAVEAALAKSRFNAAAPTERELIAAMEVDHLIGSALAARIKEAFEGNDLTPAVAHERIEAINEQVQQLYSQSEQLTGSLSYFEVEPDELDAGEFEVIVSIPGAAIDDELVQLGKEAIKLNQIIGVFSEIATGSRDPVKIRAVASSDPTFFLASVPAVAAAIAVGIERVAALYERILNIIKLHREMKKLELPTKLLDPLKQYIDTQVGDGIEQIAKQFEREYMVKVEASRKQELKIELRRALREIAQRLDRGYGFDVRGEGTEDAGPADGEGEAAAKGTGSAADISKALKIVTEVRPKLRHFTAEADPILGLPDLKDGLDGQ